MNLGRSSTRDHCSYALPIGAFTTMDCRAAFISNAAGGGLCSAGHERGGYSSFEGGKRSGAAGEDSYIRCCLYLRNSSAGQTVMHLDITTPRPRNLPVDPRAHSCRDADGDDSVAKH